MPLRLIESFWNGPNTTRAIVYRDAEYNEYRVKFYSFDPSKRVWVHLENGDYHTDDRQDALSTACTWACC